MEVFDNPQAAHDRMKQLNEIVGWPQYTVTGSTGGFVVRRYAPWLPETFQLRRDLYRHCIGDGK